MFAVYLAEKGGAEKRETFNKSDLVFGRVSGNDIVLPKGNVSKQHAKLVFKDGRFIVSDMNSTNGTYVNGRKITQATIVREGDKIYVGDFVIRLEILGDDESAAPDKDAEMRARDNAPALAGATSAGDELSDAGPGQEGPRSLPPPLPPGLGAGPATHGPPGLPGLGGPGLSSPAGPPPIPAGPPGLSGPPGLASGPPGIRKQPTLSNVARPGAPAPPRAGSPGPSAPLVPNLDGAKGAAAGTGPMPRVQNASVPPPAPLGGPAVAPQPNAPLPGASGAGAKAASPLAPPAGPVGQPFAGPGVAGVSGPSVSGPSIPGLGTSGTAATAAVPGPAVVSAAASPPGGVSMPAAAIGFGGAAMTMPQALGGGAGVGGHPPTAAPAPLAAPGVPWPFPAPAPAVTAGTGTGASRYLALIALMKRLRERHVSPLGFPLQESHVREQIAQLTRAGELADSVDADTLIKDVMSEWMGVGPIAGFLDDPTVQQVHVARFDRLLIERSDRIEAIELGYTSEAAVLRCADRLPAYLEHKGLSGLDVSVTRPGAISIWRRVPFDGTLDELVRTSGGPRNVFRLMEGLLAFGAHIWVVGANRLLCQRALATIASAVPSGTRLMSLLPGVALSLPHAHCGYAPPTLESVTNAAGSAVDRLVLVAQSGDWVRSALNHGASTPMLFSTIARPGAQGAGSTARAFEQLLALTGLSGQAPIERSAAAALIDLVVEVHESQGQVRISKISEFDKGAPVELYRSENGTLVSSGRSHSATSELEARGFGGE
jgi:pilus assembly protein CpaF